MNTKSTNAAIDTVIIFSRNLADPAEFYQQGLELGPPRTASDEHIGFELADTYLGFDCVDQLSVQNPGGVTIWFRVNDLDAAFSRLAALGARVRYSPREKVMGQRLASLLDPEGNVFGLSVRA